MYGTDAPVYCKGALLWPTVAEGVIWDLFGCSEELLSIRGIVPLNVPFLFTEACLFDNVPVVYCIEKLSTG